MRALSTIDIYKELKNDYYARHFFKGVLPRDQLPRYITYPSAYVINTHPSYKPGEHWLAVFYDANKMAYFFDSFGLPPSYYGLEKYLKSTAKQVFYNHQQLQGITAITCGYYCIYFIMLKSRNFNLNEIINHFCINHFKISFIVDQ